MTDPIADMIIRLKNGYLARKQEVVVPYSKVKESMGKLLEAKKYVESMSVEGDEIKELKFVLRYIGSEPAISDVKRYSKPGRRVYVTKKNVPRTLGGYGLTIVSTSVGVMSDEEARAKGVGGEVLCQVW